MSATYDDGVRDGQSSALQEVLEVGGYNDQLVDRNTRLQEAEVRGNDLMLHLMRDRDRWKIPFFVVCALMVPTFGIGVAVGVLLR